MKKIITALGLSFSLLIMPQISYNAFAIEEIQSISNDSIRRLIPTNNDSEFPLSIYADIANDSIKYDKLEEPVYGFTTALNTEVLDVDLIFSLKEDYRYFTNYELTICNDDYSTVLVSSTCESSGDIVFENFSVDKTYRFQVVLSNDYSKAEYVGQLYSAIELDSTFAMDLSYQLTLIEGDTSLFLEPIIEDENELVNDKRVNAHYVPFGRTIKGDFSQSDNDVDWFYFLTEYSSTGISRVDISVSVPENQKICLTLEMDDGTLVSHSQKGVGIHFSFDMSSNAQYRLKLEPESNWANSDKYYLTINTYPELAWYSQIAATSNNFNSNWTDYKLDTLDITVSGTTKKAFLNGKGNGDWMETSCGIVCAAMIFRNKQKTMNGYDFRTNFMGELMADPFTVMLANCKSDGTEMSEDTILLKPNCYNTPDEIQYYRVAEAFDATCVYLKDKSSGGWTIQELKSLIDTYGMIMVYLPGHWMVFTGYTNGSTFASSFYVYDPYASTRAAGANLLLSKTTSGFSETKINDLMIVVAYK